MTAPGTGAWDVAVIGGGVAGLVAAAAAASQGSRTCAVDGIGGGGTLMNVGELHDSPLTCDGATGADLAATLLTAAVEAGVEFVMDTVVSVESAGSLDFMTAGGERHRSAAVVVATGYTTGNLGLAEQDLFVGRGLSTCAQCDGPLFRGKLVVVAGSDDWAATEALELATLAEHVTVVVSDSQPAWSATRTERLEACPNIATLCGTDIVGLEGEEQGLTALRLRDQSGERAIPASGLFPYVGARPNTSFARELVPLDPSGHVMTVDGVSTSVPGVFAAGDVCAPGVRSVTAAAAAGLRAGRLASVHALRPGSAF